MVGMDGQAHACMNAVNHGGNGWASTCLHERSECVCRHMHGEDGGQ